MPRSKSDSGKKRRGGRGGKPRTRSAGAGRPYNDWGNPNNMVMVPVSLLSQITTDRTGGGHRGGYSSSARGRSRGAGPKGKRKRPSTPLSDSKAGKKSKSKTSASKKSTPSKKKKRLTSGRHSKALQAHLKNKAIAAYDDSSSVPNADSIKPAKLDRNDKKDVKLYVLARFEQAKLFYENAASEVKAGLTAQQFAVSHVTFPWFETVEHVPSYIDLIKEDDALKASFYTDLAELVGIREAGDWIAAPSAVEPVISKRTKRKTLREEMAKKVSFLVDSCAFIAKLKAGTVSDSKIKSALEYYKIPLTNDNGEVQDQSILFDSLVQAVDDDIVAFQVFLDASESEGDSVKSSVEEKVEDFPSISDATLFNEDVDMTRVDSGSATESTGDADISPLPL